MDQEIQKLIIDAESKATEILIWKRHTLDALAEALMKVKKTPAISSITICELSFV